jgi:hypothetical protein
MQLFARLGIISVAAFSLWGCVQARRTPFDESAFVPYARSGSATIEGTAYTNLPGHKKMQVASSNAVIKLVPANAYTDEIAKRHYFNRVKLEPADPSYEKYVRRTNPDDDGHFVFRNLPAGNYYVSCHLRWQAPSWYTDADGVLQPTTENLDQWIYARVSVAGGQTVDVENWFQGK